jgi:hypothetical protein
MKIVRFKNGKYGVRRFWLFRYEFLSVSGCWWPKSMANDFELEHDYQEALNLFSRVKDKGEPI